MKSIYALVAGFSLSAQAADIIIPSVDVVAGTNYQVQQTIPTKSFDDQIHMQQTSPGMKSPYIGAFTGNQVDQTVNGIRFNNSLFRTGPNQYYSWIPQSFVSSVSLSDGGNVGGSINRTLSIPNSHVGAYNFGQTASYKQSNYGIALSRINMNDIKTARGTIPHSAYNQDAFMFQGKLDDRNTTTFVYSRSHDIDRPDRWNGGYKSSGYQAPSVYTWELQQYTLLQHQIQMDKWDLNLAWQNSTEHIKDGTKYVKSNLDGFTINGSYWINNNWSLYSTNTFEYIKYDNGVTGSKDDRYRTTKQGVRWVNTLGGVDILASAGLKQVNTAGFDTFNNQEGSLILGYKGFFTSADYSTNSPSYTMLKQAITTGKGLSLANNNLNEERAVTLRAGYKVNGFYFDVYKKNFMDAFYQSTVAPNTYMTINSGSADVYGSTLAYRNASIMDTKFGIDTRIEYAYGTQDTPTGTQPVSKTPDWNTYTKLNYGGVYTELLYQRKDNHVSSFDRDDVRMYGQNKGYKVVNIGYEGKHNDLTFSAALNNAFNDDGRVLGSSTDVMGRYLWFSLKYEF